MSDDGNVDGIESGNACASGIAIVDDDSRVPVVVEQRGQRTHRSWLAEENRKEERDPEAQEGSLRRSLEGKSSEGGRRLMEGVGISGENRTSWKQFSPVSLLFLQNLLRNHYHRVSCRASCCVRTLDAFALPFLWLVLWLWRLLHSFFVNNSAS